MGVIVVTGVERGDEININADALPWWTRSNEGGTKLRLDSEKGPTILIVSETPAEVREKLVEAKADVLARAMRKAAS